MLTTHTIIRNTSLVPKVTYKFGDQVKVVQAKSGDSLLQIGLDAGVPLEHACGGNGFCTTCLCNVEQGIEQLEERTDREENMGITEDPERLTCQAIVEGEGDIVVDVPDM